MTSHILALPRFVRMLLVGMVSLCWVLAIFPLVDRVYLAFFYHPNTIDLPAHVSVSFGLLAYLIGWWAVVGARWGKVKATRTARAYVWSGVLVVLFCVALVMFGLTMLDLFAG